jgi:hypothetical protein
MGLTQSYVDPSQNHDRQSTAGRPVPLQKARKSSVFLRGCTTDEEHKSMKRMMIEMLKNLNGEEGLVACGLEYRPVTLGEDGKLVEDVANEFSETIAEVQLLQQIPEDPSTPIENGENHLDHGEEKKDDKHCDTPSRISKLLSTSLREKELISPSLRKTMSMTRLFHKDSNTMITSTNRKEFIADGAMYDVVCRLATEYSQEVMIREGQMEWVTIAQDQVVDDSQPTTEPIRALVSSRLVQDESKLDTEPTLLIVTGRGRVRAGVFSRQHLLTSGLECSSAVQFVREARTRNMNLMVLDPNARGDRVGMTTFETSMAHLFRRWENGETDEHTSCSLERVPQNLYILSHSQSGSQFVRHLLNKTECYLPHMGAVAFTDSTHNIQWAKRQNLQGLENLLESDKCIYFRRTDGTIEYMLKPFASVGQAVDTDEFWEHRFGKIKTLCAGTSEHSLTNWFARVQIWDHFDRFLTANEMKA